MLLNVRIAVVQQLPKDANRSRVFAVAQGVCGALADCLIVTGKQIHDGIKPGGAEACQELCRVIANMTVLWRRVLYHFNEERYRTRVLPFGQNRCSGRVAKKMPLTKNFQKC